MSQLRHLTLRPEFRAAQEGEQGESGTQKTPGFVPRNQAGEEPVRESTQEGGPPQRQASPTEGCMDMAPYMLAMVAIFYFLLIRPQQKQEKQRKAMLSAINVGDKVVTSGGIHGKISSMNDQTVTLSVDQKIKLTFDRQNIARVDTGEKAPDPKS